MGKRKTTIKDGEYSSFLLYDENIDLFIDAMKKIENHEKRIGFKKCILSAEELGIISDIINIIENNKDEY